MKQNRFLVLVLLIVVLVGLALTHPDKSADPARAQGPTDFPGLPLPTERGTMFSGSGACAGCHSNMVDEAGEDVSLDAAWRSTMMANAARDPYWQASVRVEVLEAPHLADIIEDKCATCHMPMARTTANAQGEAGLMLDDGFLSPEHDLHTLAMDGNSCTLCHQIEDVGLGEPDSFSGGFVIDPDLPSGERRTYSQFEVAPDLAALMQGASGFIPLQGLHTAEAKMCATCHTLYTPYIDAEGEVVGVFPEQMPYLEWLHGDYAENTPCQGCHMPEAEGGVVTSVTGGPPRSPFSKHNFVGGNVYMQAVFMAFGEEMEVTAASEHFAATHGRVLDQLQNRTAIVTLENTRIDDSLLSAEVAIETLTGHKFPAGFPSRRVFIHLVVTDASGALVFESGAYDEHGFVTGDDHDADPLRFEPHYAQITSPDQVQIYETVMMDTDGNVTTNLLRGAGYIKNNRLLPQGFDKATAHDDIAVRGAAAQDEDFVGGGDRVVYQIAVGEAEGPFTVTAELLYLSISHNWAEKIRGYDTVETARFLGYYDATPNTPVLVGSASAQVE